MNIDFTQIIFCVKFVFSAMLYSSVGMLEVMYTMVILPIVFSFTPTYSTFHLRSLKIFLMLCPDNSNGAFTTVG
jgi:hypothetical protein